MENTVAEKINTENTNTEETGENRKKDRYIFQYILSFILPIIGFVMGAILLTKDEKIDRLHGEICVILGLINVCACFIISLM